MSQPLAKLALEDGTVYTGRGFGAVGETFGEVVFNTSMTGYQEVLTDPSYKGQIVTMTYPLIGNYGINAEDRESQRAAGRGLHRPRTASRMPSNFRSQQQRSTPISRRTASSAWKGIDTRALVRRLRVRGAMNGVLSTTDLDDASLVNKARSRARASSAGIWSREVMPDKAFAWRDGFTSPFCSQRSALRRKAGTSVVALDFGMKWNILRCLVQIGCEVTVVPGTASAEGDPRR